MNNNLAEELFKQEEQPWETLKFLTLDEAEEYSSAVIADPLTFFCPSGDQERYIKTIVNTMINSRIPVVLFMAGNGCGKTETSLHTVANIIYKPQNGWFDYPEFRDFPFPKLCWYVTTKTALTDVVIPAFIKIFAGRKYRMEKEGKPNVSKIYFDDEGWVITFLTTEQDADKFESATVGLIIGDEPLPEPIWKALKSRRRMGCLILLPMTPLECDPYIILELQKSAQQTKGTAIVEASVYGACKRRGVRGYLDPQTIDEMVDSYDDDEKDARIYGKVGYFKEHVLPDFSKALHVVEPEAFPIKPNYLIYHVVDPHDGKPNAEQWWAYTPEGRWICFAELPMEHNISFWDMKNPKTIDQDILEINFVEKKFAMTPFIRILDRHFGNQTRGSAKRTLFQDYALNGMPFVESYNGGGDETELTFGHNKLRQCMKIMPDGFPGLVIHNTCFHTIESYTNYVRRVNKSQKENEKGIGTGKLIEKYKHFVDCSRYVVCYDVVPQSTKTDTKKRTYSNNVFSAF